MMSDHNSIAADMAGLSSAETQTIALLVWASQPSKSMMFASCEYWPSMTFWAVPVYPAGS